MLRVNDLVEVNGRIGVVRAISGYDSPEAFFVEFEDGSGDWIYDDGDDDCISIMQV